MGKELFESRGLQGREELVQSIKVKAGELDDLLILIAQDKDSRTAESTVRPRECHRLTEIARTNLEQSVMWAVKAVSRS